MSPVSTAPTLRVAIVSPLVAGYRCELEQPISSWLAERVQAMPNRMMTGITNGFSRDTMRRLVFL
jgi:hypothetical protein